MREIQFLFLRISRRHSQIGRGNFSQLTSNQRQFLFILYCDKVSSLEAWL